MNQIKDLLISQISDPAVLLSEHQHLLRRFGAIYYHNLENDEKLLINSNKEADEVWILIQGMGVLTLKDCRENSPSFEMIDEIRIVESELSSVLIPFGIEKYFQALTYCQLIRVSTHAE